MKHIDFYLDFISPYAHLAFEHLPQALEGLSCSVAYKPVLLGAILKHHGQLGPAEIPAKRSWTYRHVLWLGHANGIQIEMPASHPTTRCRTCGSRCRPRTTAASAAWWPRPSCATCGAAARKPAMPRAWLRWRRSWHRSAT